MAGGLLCWYHFKPCSKILYLDSSNIKWDVFLKEQECTVDSLTVTRDILSDLEMYASEAYDYIVAIRSVEIISNQAAFIEHLMRLLKADGTLLLGMDNRLGAKFFCGDRDPYTDGVFDSILAYRRIVGNADGMSEGRLYSQYDAKKWIEMAGVPYSRFYSVLPNLEAAQLVYAEDYLPEENLGIRSFPMYNYPNTVFLEEQFLYESLIQNGLFHQMANSYLIECPKNGLFSDTKHVTVSINRSEEDAMITRIRRDGKVEKKAIYKEGTKRLKNIYDNTEKLKSRGIHVVEGVLEEDTYVMPYIEAQTAMDYFKNLLRGDIDKFLLEMDRFRELIMHSSTFVEGDSDDSLEISGNVLKEGFYDLVPLNCFMIDGEFVFYDQEFCIPNYPANVLVFRLIELLYNRCPDLEAIYAKSQLWERYGIQNEIEKLGTLANQFTAKLRNEEVLTEYNEKHFANYWKYVARNHNRMQYGMDDIEKILVDIFAGLDKQKLVIYGAGKYYQEFKKKYGSRYSVACIIDNNPEKIANGVDGISVVSMDDFVSSYDRNYKIIICVKDYKNILLRLQHEEFRDISVFNPNYDYDNPASIVGTMWNTIGGATYQRNKNVEDAPRMTIDSEVNPDDVKREKKYHVGYVAGAFDMFHIGHLNLIRRAKERCDYLIVGVMSDARMIQLKGKEPVIPCKERMQIVASCKYVDRVEELQLGKAGINDAFQMFHFDCMFSGDDHATHPGWLAEREVLRKQGSDIVFVPYTKEQSSTDIRKKMQQ